MGRKKSPARVVRSEPCAKWLRVLEKIMNQDILPDEKVVVELTPLQAAELSVYMDYDMKAAIYHEYGFAEVNNKIKSRIAEIQGEKEGQGKLL